MFHAKYVINTAKIKGKKILTRLLHEKYIDIKHIFRFVHK